VHDADAQLQYTDYDAEATARIAEEGIARILWVMRLVLAAVLALASAFASADLRFSVTYPKEALDGPFSGRVVVYLSKRSSNPRNGPNWFNPEPIYSRVVEGASPGEPIVLDDANTVGFPGRLNDLEAAGN